MFRRELLPRPVVTMSGAVGYKCLLYRKMQLTYTAWVVSLTTRDWYRGWGVGGI